MYTSTGDFDSKIIFSIAVNAYQLTPDFMKEMMPGMNKKAMGMLGPGTVLY